MSAEASGVTNEPKPVLINPAVSTPSLKEGHITIQENQRGICFDDLLGPYLSGATKIVITDPYIRVFFQARNIMELLETIVKHKPEDEEIDVHLITAEDNINNENQVEFLGKIQENIAPVGINFSWEIVDGQSIHARHIVTDHGWKILLDRGLDIFQRYDMNDAFSIANRLQRYRPCKTFEVTYLRVCTPDTETTSA